MTATADDITRRLEYQRIVVIPVDAWATVADAFEEVERHSTGIAGDLIVVRAAGRLAAVERPAANERVIRRLDSDDEARRFVRERMEQYERMWDGCGCRIDYYS